MWRYDVDWHSGSQCVIFPTELLQRSCNEAGIVEKVQKFQVSTMQCALKPKSSRACSPFFGDDVVQPPDLWRVNACSRFQADRYDFCWQFYDCSFISHASFRLDECDMAGKTFVDLGSGVGQVLLRSHRIHLNCNSVGRLLHNTGTSQLRVTGLHDGCSAVQCIQVYCSLFLIR